MNLRNRLIFAFFLLLAIGASIASYHIASEKAYQEGFEHAELDRGYFYERTDLATDLLYLHLLNSGSQQELREKLHSQIRNSCSVLKHFNKRFPVFFKVMEASDSDVSYRQNGIQESFKDHTDELSKEELDILIKVHLSYEPDPKALASEFQE